MIEEEQITIPLAYIKSWLDDAIKGQKPLVNFNLDSNAMLLEAYEKRGHFLCAIQNGIQGWVRDK